MCSTFPYDSGWLQAAYVLIVWLGIAGAVAGKRDRRTRELAEREAVDRRPDPRASSRGGSATPSP